MYEYHGWFTVEYWQPDEKSEIATKLKAINEPYPVNLGVANGQLHIAVSGNPNRDLDISKLTLSGLHSRL